MNSVKIPFEKDAISLDQQIELMLERGLIIKDIEKAKNYLSTVSYYRLSAYFKPFQQYENYIPYDRMGFDSQWKSDVFWKL